MITRNDVVRLLALAAVYDQRTVGPEDVQGWLLVAEQQRWPAEASRRILVEHYGRGADRPRITPAIVSDRLRHLRGRAAESFALPRVPDDVANADYPAWLREQLAEHVDRVLDRWATDGEDPPSAPAVEPAPIRTLPQLVAAAPVHARGELAAGVRTVTTRRVQLDPQRRAQALRELDDARAAADPGTAS